MNFSRWMSLAALLIALAGCGTHISRPAPVEDRAAPRNSTASAPAPAAVSSATTSGGTARKNSTDKAGANPGSNATYTVRPGDTLGKIAADNNKTWQELARLNNLDNPNVLEVGQVLRLNGNAPVTAAPLVDTSQASSDISFSWPVPGQLIAGFDEQKNKGFNLAGQAGDPVLAAADGKVVFAGSSLKGYGNLVIIKHDANFLTAYAHNQSLLVKEDQLVRKGQKIAEMGSTDSDRVMLHFEIRRQGKPVDPARYLPNR